LKTSIGEHKLLYIFEFFCCYNTYLFLAISGTLFI